MKTVLWSLILIMAGFNARADVVSVDENGNDHTYSEADLIATYGGTFDQNAYDDFKYYADQTGGTFGFCPQYTHLPKVMNEIFDSIMGQKAPKNDVALVLDVTSSMTDEIEAVKQNLVNLIAQFQTASNKNDIQVSLVIYRDKGDDFVTKVVQNLTSDMQLLSEQVKVIKVAGGGDNPEAVLDAIETAGTQINWRVGASHNMIVIGDAPGHKTAVDTGLNAAQVLAKLGQISDFVIHPLLVANISGKLPPGIGGGFGDFSDVGAE